MKEQDIERWVNWLLDIDKFSRPVGGFWKVERLREASNLCGAHLDEVMARYNETVSKAKKCPCCSEEKEEKVFYCHRNIGDDRMVCRWRVGDKCTENGGLNTCRYRIDHPKTKEENEKDCEEEYSCMLELKTRELNSLLSWWPTEKHQKIKCFLGQFADDLLKLDTKYFKEKK